MSKLEGEVAKREGYVASRESESLLLTLQALNSFASVRKRHFGDRAACNTRDCKVPDEVRLAPVHEEAVRAEGPVDEL